MPCATMLLCHFRTLGPGKHIVDGGFVKRPGNKYFQINFTFVKDLSDISLQMGLDKGVKVVHVLLCCQ